MREAHIICLWVSADFLFMLTKTQKKEIVENLTKKILESKSIVFSDFSGVKVGDINDLRIKLRDSDIEYQVVKKNLIKLSLGKAGLGDFPLSGYKGQISLAVSKKDEIAPAKILKNFSKGHETFKMLGGILDLKFISGEEVNSLAKLPPKEELLARLAFLVSYPIFGFVGALQANIRNLIFVLQNIQNNNNNRE